ncbi:DUF4352 domain-containing protein [Oenococcus sicerae]|uniref:DUF4352 domain-containing protein n=1 Tax=Oenococcus sicerae TaxID=2203724 RepID=UPI0039EBEFD8
MNRIKKPFYKKWWFWVIIVVLVIGIGSQAGKSKSSTASDSTNSTKSATKASSSSTSAKTTYNVGETFNQNGVQITVEESDIPDTSGWLGAPDSGKEFVANKVKIVNNSSKQVDFNMFNWEFFDNGAQVNDIAVPMDANANDPYKPDFSSGKIDPKATFEGWLVYQGTPNGKHQLRYKASFWLGKTINFNVK